MATQKLKDTQKRKKKKKEDQGHTQFIVASTRLTLPQMGVVVGFNGTMFDFHSGVGNLFTFFLTNWGGLGWLLRFPPQQRNFFF